jgi:hypothetical protein
LRITWLNDHFEHQIDAYDEGGFDWWCIEHLLPQELTHAAGIAHLVAGRIDTISAALKQMRTSSSAALVWHSIRAPSLPDLQETIAWAQQRLVDFQELSAIHARDKST